MGTGGAGAGGKGKGGGKGGREASGALGIYNRPFQVQICIARLNLYSDEKALMKLPDDFDAN